MRLPREASEDGGMGLTPLVDVVFLLLIFFVVATSFKEPTLALNLPDAQGVPDDRREPLRVELRESGEVWIDGTLADIETLSSVFAERAGDVDGVELRADQAVTHGRVVEVLDQARQHDLTEISIAVEAKPERSE